MAESAGNDEKNTERVVALIRKSPVAMLTHLNADAQLVSHPMATQDVDYDGTVRFVARRDTTKVDDLVAIGTVNVSYSNQGSWVSLSGRAEVKQDP
ncbi:MAG: pyridoxamine 5-phosphate oxidase [Nocardioidaceae bacterium]|nr:pyridoxamine 5-phosphate oxidase [Nocardioidaceae bacterium]